MNYIPVPFYTTQVHTLVPLNVPITHCTLQIFFLTRLKQRTKAKASVNSRKERMEKYKQWATTKDSTQDNANKMDVADSEIEPKTNTNAQQQLTTPPKSPSNSTFITSAKRKTGTKSDTEVQQDAKTIQAVQQNLLSKFDDDVDTTATTTTTTSAVQSAEDLFSPRKQATDHNVNPHLAEVPHPMEDEEMEEDLYEFNYDQLLSWEYDVEEFDPYVITNCNNI